jgi:hypothetical protein
MSTLLIQSKIAIIAATVMEPKRAESPVALLHVPGKDTVSITKRKVKKCETLISFVKYKNNHLHM